MALCLALYGRDSRVRGGMAEEEYSETFKAEIYDSIKRELAKDAPEDWVSPDELELLENINRDPDQSLGIMHGYRPFHALLSEFGW